MVSERIVLFTPGPVQTSPSVKQAMQQDYGSRDVAFVSCVHEIQKRVLGIAGVDPTAWACVPMQGPGTMGIEAAISSTTPRSGGKYLVLRSGKYSERQGEVSVGIGLETIFFDTKEGWEMDLVALDVFLQKNAVGLTNIGMVHHETSTGMVNPIEGVHHLVRRHCPAAVFLIDAVSSFGGIPIDVERVCDVLVTSSNKCIHSVPGFSLILIRRTLLGKSKGCSRSFTLDVHRQMSALDKTGQFPFTPPVHALMAFQQALREHERDGGTSGRVQRYNSLASIAQVGMTSLGFTLFLDPHQPSFGNIVVAFNMPKHPRWNFMEFSRHLKEEGTVIYPGKASNAETFRIGCIGDLQEDDMRRIVDAAKGYLQKFDVVDLVAHPHHNYPRSKL